LAIYFVAGLAVTFIAERVSPSCRAEELGDRTAVAVHPRTVVRLTNNLRASISEVPLRDALNQIATLSDVNLVIDRRVDPTTPVNTGKDPTTAYQAILGIADSANLRVVVVENVIIVGRGPWVESLVGVILADPPRGKILDSVQWPELSTPTIAADAASMKLTGLLPHDLWPETHWKEIRQETAAQIIAAQFDQMPTASGALVPIVAAPRVTALYPGIADVTKEIKSLDPGAVIVSKKNHLSAKATPAAHIAAINRWLRTTKTAATVDIDKALFTLRLQDAVAEDALRQLSATAGLQLIIRDDAKASCGARVSLVANDVTLRQLTNQIADQINVTLTWNADQLVVQSASN